MHTHIAQPCSPCCMTLSSTDSPVRQRANLGHRPYHGRHYSKSSFLTLRSVRCWRRLGLAQAPGALVLLLSDRRECTLRDALLPFWAVSSLKQPRVPRFVAVWGEYGVLRAEMI